MGLHVVRLKYKDSFPSLEVFKEQFAEQTGLFITILTSINIADWPDTKSQMLEKTLQDIEIVERVIDSKYPSYDFTSLEEELSIYNRVSRIMFYHSQFYGVPFFIKDQTIELEYEENQFYFAESIVKVLFDLGAVFVSLNDTSKEFTAPSEKWKKLQRWDMYRWYNRPKK